MQMMEIKGKLTGNEVKLFLFADNMVYIRDTKISPENARNNI